MNRKTVVSILATASLVTSLVLAGCGASEDDNNQPTIKPISDKTLNQGDKKTVDVNITDADVDDTHIISAFTDNTTVAAVSVDEASITITGKAVGIATLTVFVSDDSGQDNAAATPVTFKATVNEPGQSVRIGIGLNQPPSSFVDKGACTVGMTLQPGEGCSYDSNDSFAEIIFFVRLDGTVCREQVPLFRGELPIPDDLQPRNLKFCVEWNIERDDFFETDFAASKNPDGSWTIDSVP